MENERRLAVMCNLSEGFWEAGRKEGMEQKKIAILKNALKMGLPEEQIQKLLGISGEEMNQLKQELFECV